MKLAVGSKIRFAEEKRAYTVQASNERFAICTKPFAPRKTVLYTIVDFDEQIRGTENLVFGAGFETRAQCEEALARLTSSNLDDRTEISHRNRVPLNITGCRVLTASDG